MTGNVLIPRLLQKSSARWAVEALALFGGVLLVSALAQVVIRLPWTPVPITGQTFGVTLMALLWGRKRASAVIVSYLGLGFVGLPVLAGGAAGLAFGPTLGYLCGMILSAMVIGELADRGYTKTWVQTMGVCMLGSACVLICGAFVLSFFVPASAVLTAGILPFLPGDFIKNSLAAAIAKGR